MLSNLIGAWLVLTVLSIGLSVSAGDLIGAARQYGLLLRALVANVLLVPLLAVGIYHAFALPVEIGTGMLVCAATPGSPIGIKLTQMARGDVPAAVGLGIAVSVVTTPAVAKGSAMGQAAGWAGRIEAAGLPWRSVPASATPPWPC